MEPDGLELVAEQSDPQVLDAFHPGGVLPVRTEDFECYVRGAKDELHVRVLDETRLRGHPSTVETIESPFRACLGTNLGGEVLLLQESGETEVFLRCANGIREIGKQL